MDVLGHRYDRNQPIISPEKQRDLKAVKVAIVGLGGLGGYVAELLARIGVGELVLIDKDVFEVSNLNRQLFSKESNLGLSKVDEAKKLLADINSEVKVTTHRVELKSINDLVYLEHSHYIFDCLDNIKGKLLLQQLSVLLNAPLIHGAISQWEGQFGFFLPERRYLEDVYPFGERTSVDEGANLATLVTLVASMQVQLLLTYWLNRDDMNPNVLHRFNIMTGESISIDFNH